MIPLGVLAQRRATSGQLITFADVDGPQLGNQTPIPFLGMNVGAEGATRTVIVALGAYGNTTFTRYPASVTIGGVAATMDARHMTPPGHGSIWRATVPTGTTADVLVTANGLQAGVSYFAYVFVSPSPLAVVASALDDASDATLSATLSSVSGGHVIAVAGNTTSVAPYSWSGAAAVGTDSGSTATAAAHGPTTDATHAVQVTATGTLTAVSRMAVVTYQGA